MPVPGSAFILRLSGPSLPGLDDFDFIIIPRPLLTRCGPYLHLSTNCKDLLLETSQSHGGASSKES